MPEAMEQSNDTPMGLCNPSAPTAGAQLTLNLEMVVTCVQCRRRPDFGEVAAALKEQAKEAAAAAKAAAAAATAATPQRQQQPAPAGSASPGSPAIAAVALDVDAGPPEAAAGKQEAAEAARPEKRERTVHESLRDLRKAITSGRSFSFRPRSASGSVAASPESASKCAFLCSWSWGLRQDGRMMTGLSLHTNDMVCLSPARPPRC